jgi:diguanylate cyclase (GGDEF)-like protein/hemerythrin-like metal-binding protein
MTHADDDRLALPRSLFRRLPVPLVLCGHSGAVEPNDRFAEVFLPGQLADPDLLRLLQQPDGQWKPLRLRRRDGRAGPTFARATLVEDGVLAIVEEIAASDLVHENERLRNQVAKLEDTSATDALTGAWNRVHFERMVELETRRASRTGLSASLILLDIDHFKLVNDGFGHLQGDAVLKEFVARIRRRMRDSDALFRWGGEEFVVLATSVGYRGAATLAEGLRRTIADWPFPLVGTITASLGVTEYLDGESVEHWLKRTDDALYAAKAAGRNRIHVDRRGLSDGLHVTGSAPRLYWLDAYRCGDPLIDSEHRELFELGNALIAAAADPNANSRRWPDAVDAMLRHLEDHFRSEEAHLKRWGHAGLADHHDLHERLLHRAHDLKLAVDAGETTPSRLVNFVAKDVIALHLLEFDREFHANSARVAGAAGRAPEGGQRGPLGPVH